MFSQKAALLKLGKGGAQANISQTVLKEVPFPLPPLAEQRRIVAKLDALMQRVEASQARLEKLPGLLKKFRQAVLAAAVSGRLTEAWRAEQPAQETGADLLARIRTERRAQWEAKQRAKLSGKQLSLNDSWKQKYEEPAEPDTSELQELPEGWVWATMPVIGELNRGKSKHRPRNDDALYGGPYPFIQTGDISRANRIITSYRQTYSEFGLEQSKLWPKGTLCITIAANIADTAILGFDACFPDSVVGFLANADNIEIDFVEYFISTAKANIEHYAPATAQKNINLEILSQIAIPLPGFQEQQEIVRQVNHYFALADALEARFEQAAAMVEQLPQALLAKAFSGQLVPQDPSDEPASVLLERLRNAPAPDKPKRGRKAPASTLQLELTVSQSLHEILTQHPDGISPEKLFSLAGFTDLSVDTFYQELATLLPQLHEIKPTGEAAKKWPNTSTTLRLKTVPHAN